MYIVYEHLFPNGKRYIGKCYSTGKHRWGRNGKNYSTQPVYRAIEKYGWENIQHNIIINGLTEDEANAAEKFWIWWYNTKFPNGYNCTDGGEGSSGAVRTEEEKRLISKYSKERWANPEYKKRLATMRCKAVTQYTLSGELINTFDSIKEASIKTGLDKCYIGQCCRGNAKTCGGYVWKYVTDKFAPPKPYNNPNTPERNKNKSILFKELWKTEEFRKKVFDGRDRYKSRMLIEGETYHED